MQDETEGFGEGLDIGLAWLTIKAMRDEATHARLEVVSGRDETETWKEVNGSSLKSMFKIFRKEFAEQLTTRFLLDATPDKHTLLALQMNPSINTSPDGPNLKGKAAMAEMMMAEYKRALRRQCLRSKLDMLSAPLAPADGDAPMPDAAAADAPVTAEAALPKPEPKRRKSLLGSVAAQQVTVDTPDSDASAIDSLVHAEIERFNIISQNILAAGKGHPYYQGKTRLNLRKFWADHKTTLPVHFAVYVSEVGCKKAASANIESVFSGAGKFTEEAGSAGHILVSHMVKLHYNWKYAFLRPTTKQIIDRYNRKFRPTVHQKMVAAAAASSSAAGST